MRDLNHYRAHYRVWEWVEKQLADSYRRHLGTNRPGCGAVEVM